MAGSLARANGVDRAVEASSPGSRCENYWELLWELARTDFKLRYHGSVLGYVWALLKPLCMFLILNFVFSNLFNPKNTGLRYFSLQLIIAIILFNFFSEGTTAGLGSLLNKSNLITKIFVPRWIIVVASTVQASLFFVMNLIVIAIFCVWYECWPGLYGVTLFAFYIVMTYLLILSFAFVTAPLFVKVRDLQHTWEVVITALFYASPIVYPLSLLPARYHKIILANPIAYLVEHSKIALTGTPSQSFRHDATFLVFMLACFLVSLLVFRRLEPAVADNI
jgi:ABC-2 type transport system permease protein